MAVQGMSKSEVKSVCDELECSPSQHQANSPINKGGSKATGKKGKK
jgi:hypothetical protein